MALEDNSGMMNHFLDKKTGEIVFVSEYDVLDEDEETKKLIEDEPDRFLWIDTVSSNKGFRIMEEFVESLPDGEAKMILCKALAWKKPFSNFKDALHDYPDIREQWFEFHDKALGELATEWLEVNEIDAEVIIVKEK
jgi:hypothetical protein